MIIVFLREAYGKIHAHNLHKIRRNHEKIIYHDHSTFIATLGLSAESFAQRGAMKWRGSGGWGMGTPYQRMYDPAKVETIPRHR